ncbi:MAG: fibronectin type III domain-containing protein [Prevotella sp.]|nr:fibronectin type III domain-containing protein [Prevotella sp.]
MTIHSISIPRLLATVALTGTLAATAVTGGITGGNDQRPDDEDSTLFMRYLPGEIRDTAAFQQELQARQSIDLRASIHVLARCYGDSVVLRWAASDYVTWRYLNRVGVNIVRMDEKTLQEDTLVLGLKPATLELMRARYPETDSIGNLAMGLLYGEADVSEDIKESDPSDMGTTYQMSQDQQMQYGMALLASEWRQDVARDMAMRFCDRTARKGSTYSYLVYPAVADSTGRISVRSGICEEVENVRYRPQPFDVELTDSISYPDGVFLSWPDRGFSSYEVERRRQGSSRWKRLNEHPYIVMNAIDSVGCFYSDNVGQPGTYEYRVMAHDPFGDLTEPSPVHTVKVRDMVAPMPPVLTYIEIERRGGESDPSADVLAHIHFRKDTMEQDFVGCVPLYYHERVTEGKWRPLLDKPLARTDTMVTVDVTNLVTGQLVVAAYDTAQNVSYSMPQLLRVSDMRPPKAPQGLKASIRLEPVGDGPDSLTNALGLITLTWSPIDDDDIDYYEIIYANDPKHEFMQPTYGIVRGDTMFIDTVAVDVNQKYIYYKVRAVDYSTNEGEFSDMLQVIRPSAIPPEVAHLDSTHVDGKGIFMRWIASNEEQAAYHNVYRRLANSEKEWTLLMRCDGDSVRAAGDVITVMDHPKPNGDEEYIYAVETFNYSGISSGLSLQYMTRYTGDAVFDTPLRLFAAYDAAKKQTTLAWEADRLPEGNDWYFCIWRQGPDEDRFKFLLSADPNERSFTDYLLEAGQTAHYYIQIQMEDGRESEPSNYVTVKAPAKGE